MNPAVQAHEVAIAARRPDGSTVDATEIVAYLEQVRVAAGVIDGTRVCEPGFHVLRMALDADDDVVYVDDLVRDGLEWQGLVRSVAHRFDTVVVVDDGVVDEHGRHHAWFDDLPPGLEQHLEELAESAPSVAVHVMRADPELDIDALLISWSSQSPVEHSSAGGFTFVREASNDSPDSAVDQALKGQLPAVSLRRDGESYEAVVRVRRGRRVVQCHVARQAAPALPATVLDADLRDVLVGGTEVTSHRRKRLDAATLSRLAEAGEGVTSFAHDVAQAVGVPTSAAAWLDDDVAPGPVEVVEPGPTRIMIARVGREMARDFRREAVKGPLGGFRRFLLDHPRLTAVYGLTELALAVVFLTVAAGWGLWAPVRWILVVYLAVDGLCSLAVSAATWRGRVRA